MNWFEQYENLTDRDKDMFQETVNRLFRRTFLVSEKEEDRRFYRFAERYFQIISGYLQLAQWDLFHDRRLSVFQLYNRLEKNRQRFNLMETIVLFILRLLYDEKQRELRLTQQVMVSLQEIQEKYLALQIKDRLPPREELHRILRYFSRYSLLDLKRGNWREPDSVFVLYPSLVMVLPGADVEALSERLGNKDEEEVGNIEEPDEAEAD